jgi:hypothetical protein
MSSVFFASIIQLFGSNYADVKTTLTVYAHFFEEAAKNAVNIMDDILKPKRMFA